MRVVLDTNVFISGVFFSGPPARILEAWQDGRIVPVVSPGILQEYRRVGDELAARYRGVDLNPMLSLLMADGEVVSDRRLDEPVSRDPDDNKFLGCAREAGAEVVVSGDEDLLEVGEWEGIRVLSPRSFVDRYLDWRVVSLSAVPYEQTVIFLGRARHIR